MASKLFSLFLIISTLILGMTMNSGNIRFLFCDSLVEFLEIENEELNEIESEELSAFKMSILNNPFVNSEINRLTSTINYRIFLRQPLPPPELT